MAVRTRGLFAASMGLVTSALVWPLAPGVEAAGNSLYFANGSDHITVGANAAIFIDGTITFDAHCQGGTRPGIDDFVYPATDVYIVEAGTATDGAGLTDAGGNGPNTIVALTSGIFIGELIAATSPAGPLGDGVYDVVYDTCQDGVVDFEDEIWYEAITVDIPDGEIPPVPASIRTLKDKARQEYVDWLATQTALKALFKLDDAQALVGCLLAPTPGCLVDTLGVIYDVDGPMGKINDWFEDQILKLTLNRARNYAAIWQDPADPDFQRLPVIEVEAFRDAPLGSSPVGDALADLSAPLAEEGALADALLHAIERYQGAQAAGDTEWALTQARAAAQLSTDLRDHLLTSTAVADLRGALAADIDGLVARAAEDAAQLQRLRNSGVTPAERQRLANLGYDRADITAFEAAIVALGRQVAPTASSILDPLDDLLASRAATADGLAQSALDWQGVAETLAARVDDAPPVADAGGPYSSTGGALTLDASGSTAAAEAAIVAADWDLDGDGDFDDASGLTVVATVDRSRTIAVRVTDSAGRQASDPAIVTVEAQPVPAGTATPTADTLEVRAGDTLTLAFDVPGATDQQWFVDGELAGTGASYGFGTTADTVGDHLVGTLATVGRRSVAHAWIVRVVLPDADGDGWTATPDCDDTRADVHPGGYERIGNGRDDDCDPATIDAPVGGVTGEAFTWGQQNSVGVYPPRDLPSPLALTSIGDQVVGVESMLGAGYAVMADGTVRAWSSAGGVVGDGTLSPAYTPVTVKNVGGSGVLNGVVEVAASGGSVLARRTDGSVVAWGYNHNEQAGDGSGADYRPAVVETIDAATGQPLTGVAQVENGENTSFGVMADGTVKVWGVDHCNAGAGTTRHLYATTNPLFGNDVVQLSSGDSGGAITLHRDGTVKVCSSYYPLLGRGTGSVTLKAATTPMPVVGLGAGSGVIDVSMGHSTVTVLKADGSVWTWGRNLNHTLDVVGLPTGYTAHTPMRVPLPPGAPVVDIESDYAATTFALRADGTVLVWGANVHLGAGLGTSAYKIVGTPEVGFGNGQVIALSNSMWNGLAVVRPADPAGPQATPVRPLHWIDASVADATIGEATGGPVTISLSEAAAVDVTVGYEFDGSSGTVLIPAGATAVDVTITVADDAIDEDDEELPIRLLGVSGGVRLDDAIGIVTVVDDDLPPVVSIGTTAPIVVDEGHTSLVDVPVPVRLSAPAGGDVVVDVATVGGTAELGVDVMATDLSVLIPAGETEVLTHVYVIGDNALEDAETFTVEASDPVGATLGDAVAEVVVHDDEPLVVDVDVPAVVEGDAGTTLAPFRIAVTQPPTPTDVTIVWSIVPGTAEAESDIVPQTGEFVLGAGAVGVIEVAVVTDTAHEPLTVEHFRLAIASASAASGRVVVVDDYSAASITDDDEPLTVEHFRLAIASATAASGRVVVVDDYPAASITDDDEPAVPVVVDAGPDVETTEGAPVELRGSATGADGATPTWSVADPACAIADPASFTTTVSCPDETTTTVTLGVAGASDTATVTVTNVAPTVVIAAPTPGQQLAIGAPVALAVELGDPGVHDAVDCSVQWGDDTTPTACDQPHAYSAAGPRTIAVTATDGDGGSTTATVAVDVVPDRPSFVFDGFHRPVENLPTVNTVQPGSTVPLKFGLGGDHGPAIFEPGHPASGVRPCGGQGGGATPEPIAGQLTYDGSSGRYHFNWKTSKAWAGQCRTLVLRFVDGTEVTAEFRFK